MCQSYSIQIKRYFFATSFALVYYISLNFVVEVKSENQNTSQVNSSSTNNPYQNNLVIYNIYRNQEKIQQSSSSFSKESPDSLENPKPSYGVLTKDLTEFETHLNKSQELLNSSEYYDYQSRLHNLKQQAALDVSQGSDAADFKQPLESLIKDFYAHVADTKASLSRKQLEFSSSLMHLEQTLQNYANSLEKNENEEFKNLITQLKNNSAKSSESSNWQILIDQAHALESNIIGKSMCKSRISVKKNNENINQTDNLQNSNRVLRPGQKQYNQPKNLILINEKYKKLSIPKIIINIENNLMNYHDKGIFGSFDMDIFTNKLFSLKRNYSVMLDKKQSLSKRQENILRLELEKLENEIQDRILGDPEKS